MGRCSPSGGFKLEGIAVPQDPGTMNQEFWPLREVSHSGSPVDISIKDVVKWSKFKSDLNMDLKTSISFLSCSTGSRADFLVCTGTRVEVYDGASGEKKKAFTNSKEPVTSACIRSDGKLIAFGNSAGVIFIHDLESKLHLRTLKGHSAAVTCLEFLPNKLHLISASNDNLVKLWDVALEKEIHSFSESLDYVRFLSTCPSNANIFAAASYDGHVRIYDAHLGNLLLSLDHDGPVEAVRLINNGLSAITASKNEIRFWNLGEDADNFHANIFHQKTITSIWLSPDELYLFTGSLDHHIKVIRLQDWQVVHTWTYPHAVIGFALNGQMNRILVGTSDGKLESRYTNQPYHGGPSQNLPTSVYFQNDHQMGKALLVQLKDFRYRTALRSQLSTGSYLEVAAVFAELSRLGVADKIVSGIEPYEANMLNQLSYRHFNNPMLSQTYSGALELLLSTRLCNDRHPYFVERHHETLSPTILCKTRNKIDEELSLLSNLETLKGITELIASAHTHRHKHSV